MFWIVFCSFLECVLVAFYLNMNPEYNVLNCKVVNKLITLECFCRFELFSLVLRHV